MPKSITPKFWHLYLKPGFLITEAQIEAALNKSLDWFKYDDHCYVLYSTASLQLLKTRYLPLSKGGGRYLLAPLDLSANARSGWMSKDFWEWLKKYPGKSST